MFCQFLLFALIISDFHTLTAADDQCGSCPKHSFPSSGGRRSHTVLLITHLMWVQITQLEKAQMNILSSFTQTYMFSVSLSVEGRLSFKYFTNTWLCPKHTGDKTYWTRPSLWSQNQRPVSGSFQFSHSSKCRCKNCNTSLQSVWDWYNNLNMLSCFLSLVFELKIRNEFWMHSSPVTTQLNVSDEL